MPKSSQTLNHNCDLGTVIPILSAQVTILFPSFSYVTIIDFTPEKGVQVQKTRGSKLLNTENRLSIPVQAQKNVKKNTEPGLLIHPIIAQGEVKAYLIKDHSYFTGHLLFTCPSELWKGATSGSTDPAHPHVLTLATLHPWRQ